MMPVSETRRGRSLACAHLPGDGDERAGIHVSIRNGGDEIRCAGAAGAHAHAGLAGHTSITFRRETATLFVAREDGADFGSRERLVDFHARAAGIGEDDLDAFAFEASTRCRVPTSPGRHRRVGARYSGLRVFAFGGFQLSLLMCLSGCGWLSRVKQNPRLLQPWVLVKLTFSSTSTNGVAYYNDDQHGSLETDFQHCDG